jgi:hypothetical protein
VQQLEVALLSSAEYLQNHNNIPAAALDAAYLAVLGRPIDSAAQAATDQALAQGVSLNTLLASLVASAEARQVFLNGLYEQLLNRPVDAAGLTAWLGQLALPGGERRVQSGIAGSTELVDQLLGLITGPHLPGGGGLI